MNSAPLVAPLDILDINSRALIQGAFPLQLHPCTSHHPKAQAMRPHLQCELEDMLLHSPQHLQVTPPGELLLLSPPNPRKQHKQYDALMRNNIKWKGAKGMIEQ